MTASLASLQQAAQQQLQVSTLLHSTISSAALQQLQCQCYATAPYQSYNQRSDLLNSVATLPAQFGCSKTELARLLMLSLLAEFSLQQLPLTISSEISDNYQRSLQRIFKLWCSADTASPPETDDKFLKDIGLLTGALLPCTERVVEPFSALQRSLLYSDGIAQAAGFIRELVVAQGNKPVCRLHIHLSEINQLT
ncbi:MAG: hypothetical protein CML21_07650, partial [Rheinheimera sp.]|nr:hypothetical protein [Rheinheimera sp.]